MIGYKVVQRGNDGTLWSFMFHQDIHRPGVVPYVPGVPTTPQPGCGPLCVFASQDGEANDLLGVCEGLELWTCEFEPSSATEVHGLEGGASWVWADVSVLLNGTVLADSVTLLEKVA